MKKLVYDPNLADHYAKGGEELIRAQMPAAESNVVEIPKTSKALACAKCGRECSVSPNVCFVVCAICSAGIGQKK